MKTLSKHFFVRLLLSVLRGLVFLKQNAWSIFSFLNRPFLSVSRFVFKRIGLPIYRFVLFLKRQMFRLYLPAKNRFLFVFTNRYMFHATIVLVMAVTGVVNVQTSEVRAETFGSKSLIIGLMDKDSLSTIEEVSAERVIPVSSSGYLDTYSISAQEIDIDLLYEEQVATLLGGSAITSPTISESGVSVAARSAVEEYTVQDGDVLGSIAEKYGLSLSTLLWANNLTYRSTIRLNQKLIIPPADGVVYEVKKGDTISSIAKKYSTSTDKILSFNNLSDSSALSVGVTLMLPDATPPTSAPVTYTAPASSVFTGTRGSTAPAAATGSWVWPTDGCYITVLFNQYYRFGQHKGLDIDGDYSSYVYATRAGTVTRAGWFSGYGNCVDINHGDGYVTRYGHFSKLFVTVGEEVSAGEALGNVGTTGQSTGTHLHFEVMENGVKLNPLNFIRCPR